MTPTLTPEQCRALLFVVESAMGRMKAYYGASRTSWQDYKEGTEVLQRIARQKSRGRKR